MMASSHFQTGLTSASWTAVPLAACGVNPGICLLSIPIGAYAALLPDIDHPVSRVTWMLPPITNLASWVLRGCSWDFGLPVIGRTFTGRLLPWHIAHRGATHTEEAALVFGLVLGLPFWLLPAPLGGHWWVFALQITVGCLTHLWGDMRTSGGLRSRRNRFERRTIGRTFDTGSFVEWQMRRLIYRPVALFSMIAGTILVTTLGT